MRSVIISKFISRKFIVFLIGTFLLWFGKIDMNIWLILSLSYISVNLVHKHLGVINANKNK